MTRLTLPFLLGAALCACASPQSGWRAVEEPPSEGWKLDRLYRATWVDPFSGEETACLATSVTRESLTFHPGTLGSIPIVVVSARPHSEEVTAMGLEWPSGGYLVVYLDGRAGSTSLEYLMEQQEFHSYPGNHPTAGQMVRDLRVYELAD